MKQRYDRYRRAAQRFVVGATVLMERTSLIKGHTSGKVVKKHTGEVEITEVLHDDCYHVESARIATTLQMQYQGIE